MLYKSIEFKNATGQKIKVIEIPVIGVNSHYYFMIQVRLQDYITKLYHHPQENNLYSFREYLKRKMKWADFQELFHNKDYERQV